MTERNSMTRQELAYEARTRSRYGLDHLSKDTTHILGGLLDDIREGSDEPALVPRQSVYLCYHVSHTSQSVSYTSLVSLHRQVESASNGA
jgi:hypothetical protein